MPHTITLLLFSHSPSNLLYEKLNNFSSLIASFTTPPRAGVENWNILLHRPWGNIQGISMAIIHLHTILTNVMYVWQMQNDLCQKVPSTSHNVLQWQNQTVLSFTLILDSLLLRHLKMHLFFGRNIKVTSHIS